jgi:hypothetical protein
MNKILISFFMLAMWGSAEAGALSKLIANAISDAGDAATWAAGKTASRATRNELSDTDAEASVSQALSKVTSEEGKAGEIVSGLMLGYFEPGQVKITKKQYEEVRSKFRKKFERDQKERVRLVVQVVNVCTDVSVDYMTEVEKRLSGGKSRGDHTKFEKLLTDCSDKLSTVSGFDKVHAESYRKLYSKFEDLLSARGSKRLDNKSEFENALQILRVMSNAYRVALSKAKEDEKSWFL